MSESWPATIGEALARNDARFGARIALVGPEGGETSFAELAAHVRALAAALRARGLAPGSRVAILSRNRAEYIEVVGLAAYGYIAVPLNWRLAPDELRFVIDHAGPSAIFLDRRGREDLAGLKGLPDDMLRVALDEPGPGDVTYAALLGEASGADLAATHEPEATACIVYTSGTTGRPKGAELAHRGLMNNARVTIEEVLHLDPRDVTLCPMPLFHVGGLWYHAFPSLVAGCRTIIQSEFSPAGVLAAIARDGVTNMHVVPTMLHSLAEAPSLAATDVSSLRAIFYAGSSMPLSVLTRSMAAFPSCGFIQAYGSTEAGHVSYLSEADHRRAAEPDGPAHLLASCGRAGAQVRLALLDANRDDSGAQVGEIGVASGLVMVRYWNDPAASQAAFDRGFLRTGDLGRIDAEGYVYILDRKNDMIVTGGENVYPREVEEALLEDPAIAEAAVFDRPDEKWVQRVVVALVLRPGIETSAEAVLGRLRQRLAGYKVPKEIRFVDNLPRNPAGKVLRKVLRAAAADVQNKGDDQ